MLGTTPVGAYPSGATGCGVLDLSGNVCEWMHSLHQPYPYNLKDGREDSLAEGRRALRGGSWDDYQRHARVSCRSDYHPVKFYINIGFRLVVAPVIP